MSALSADPMTEDAAWAAWSDFLRAHNERRVARLEASQSSDEPNSRKARRSSTPSRANGGKGTA